MSSTIFPLLHRAYCLYNISSPHFNIGEPDAEAPTVVNGVTCPSDVIRNAPPGTTEMQVIYDEPTFNDAVDGQDITVTKTKESGSVFSAGTTEVLYVATDMSFKISECIISVTVNGKRNNKNVFFLIFFFIASDMRFY